MGDLRRRGLGGSESERGLGDELQPRDTFSAGEAATTVDPPSGVIIRDAEGRLVLQQRAAVPDHRACLPTLITESAGASLLRAVSCGVLVHDASGAIADANSAATELFALPLHDLLGRHLGDAAVACFDANGAALDASSCFVARARATGTEQRNATLCVRRTGVPTRWMQADAAPVFDAEGQVAYVVTTLVDITQRKEAEEAQARLQLQLLHVERLASVGTLAGGVAHEINNPLSYVLTNIDFLTSEIGPQATGEVRAALDEARLGVLRAGAVVKDLKSFVQGEDEHRTDVDVNRALEVACNAAQCQLRASDALVRRFTVVPAVRADQSRVVQMFLHLVLNAVQSCVEGVPNVVVVATHVTADGRVVVEVSDRGTGIPTTAVDDGSDPLSVLRRHSGASGLGLAICDGVVAALHGTIEVSGQVGAGSTFRVTLPGVPAANAPRRASGLLPRATAARLRVFVLDDEVVLTRALQRAIAREHEVVTSNDPAQALEAFSTPGFLAGFDVVLCDLMMPELSGVEVYERVAALLPDQAKKFIFMTGGAFTPRSREFLAKVENARLEKPFDVAQLRVLLRERTPS